MTTKIKAGVIGDGVVGTTQIAANAVTSAKLAQNSVLTKHIDDNQIGIDQLNVSDGSDGQALTTNGSGTLSFASVGVSGISSSADATAITIGADESVDFAKGVVVLGSGTTAGVYLNGTNSDTATQGNFVRYGTNFATQSNANNSLLITKAFNGSTFLDAFTVKSDGSVGIGTTTTFSNPLTLNKAAGAANSLNNQIALTHTGASTAYHIKTIRAAGTDEPAGLAFVENTTERTRINSGGAFKTKQGTSAYANSTSNYNEICSNADATANLLVRQGSTYYADCINLWYYASTGPNNVHSNFIHALDEQATRAKLYSNGGFANYQSNDSNLCDEREKKNIVVSDSTWNDVKSWNIKKFHYNEDENSDSKRYGVIAQDIEKTNPELITDWEKNAKREQELWQEDDRPLPDGVSVGDEKTPAQVQVMRKAVKEQQMYIMAIKALQEAMTEIESLKARIETLEG